MKKIVVVEDEWDLALNLKEILESLGYQVLGIFSNGVETLDFLNDTKVDLAIIDISLQGDLDGIELTKKLKSSHGIPVLFLTAFADLQILDRLTKINYEGYLLKPFTLERLKSAVYLTLKKYIPFRSHSKQKVLKIRDKGFLVPVSENDIYFLKADGLYTKIYCKSKIYTIRDILKDVMVKLSDKKFLRVHKSYLVNIHHIESFNSKEIIIDENTIPIRRGFYKTLKSVIISRLQ